MASNYADPKSKEEFELEMAWKLQEEEDDLLAHRLTEAQFLGKMDAASTPEEQQQVRIDFDAAKAIIREEMRLNNQKAHQQAKLRLEGERKRQRDAKDA